MFAKILHTFFSKGLVGLCNLALLILTTNFLGAEGRGSISIIITSITLLIVFCNVLGGSILVYLVPRFPLSQLIVPSALWAFLISGIGTLILWFTGLVEHKFLLHIFLLSCINAWMGNNIMVLVAKQRIVASNILGVLQALIVLCVSFVFFVWLDKRDEISFIIALYVAYGSMLLLSQVMVNPYYENEKFSNLGSQISKMFNYGLMVQVGSILTLFIYRMSYYMIEQSWGKAELGVYSVGVTLSEAIWLIGGSIALNLFSKVSNTEDRVEAQEITLRLTRISFFLTVLVVLPLLVLPVGVFSFVFGDEFSGVKPVILFLAPGIVLFSMNAVLNHYFSGTAQYKICTSSSATGFVIALSLNFLLIPQYGMMGAAIASSTAYTAMTIFQIVSFKRQSGRSLGEFIFRLEDFIWIKKNFLSKK